MQKLGASSLAVRPLPGFCLICLLVLLLLLFNFKTEFWLCSWTSDPSAGVTDRNLPCFKAHLLKYLQLLSKSTVGLSWTIWGHWVYISTNLDYSQVVGVSCSLSSSCGLHIIFTVCESCYSDFLKHLRLWLRLPRFLPMFPVLTDTRHTEAAASTPSDGIGFSLKLLCKDYSSVFIRKAFNPEKYS